jgi:sugar lactone lactonase YvrE
MFDKGPFQLGEGPIFDARTNALLWVDIKGRLILRRETDGAQTEATRVNEEVGCIALTSDANAVVAALRSGWYEVNLSTGEHKLLASAAHATPACRFNDGAVDSRGRLWTGSLEDNETAPLGELVRLDPDGSFQAVDAGFVCSNGVDWSADGRWMYFVDSRRDLIYRYPVDRETGEVGQRQPFINTRDLAGIPDGLAVDAEGTIWCAFWDGAAIHGFNADGTLVETINLPVLRPTSLTFGGPDLTVMYVTSASIGLSAGERHEWPESGAVLTRKARCPGLPANIFARGSAEAQ